MTRRDRSATRSPASSGPLALLVELGRGRVELHPGRDGDHGHLALDHPPESALTAPVLPVLGRLWKGYARQALETLSELAGRPERHVSTFWPARRDGRCAPRRFGCWTPRTTSSEQSRRNPDGTGLGVFDEQGRPQVHKQPIAAWQDADFATEAHDLTGTTFVAHVRYATTGVARRAQHPSVPAGRPDLRAQRRAGGSRRSR